MIVRCRRSGRSRRRHDLRRLCRAGSSIQPSPADRLCRSRRLAQRNIAAFVVADRHRRGRNGRPMLPLNSVSSKRLTSPRARSPTDRNLHHRAGVSVTFRHFSAVACWTAMPPPFEMTRSEKSRRAKSRSFRQRVEQRVHRREHVRDGAPASSRSRGCRAGSGSAGSAMPRRAPSMKQAVRRRCGIQRQRAHQVSCARRSRAVEHRLEPGLRLQHVRPPRSDAARSHL